MIFAAAVPFSKTRVAADYVSYRVVYQRART